MKKALLVSEANSVWLSGKPLSLSNSIGVSLLSQYDLVSPNFLRTLLQSLPENFNLLIWPLVGLYYTTCLNLDGAEPPSPVTIVLDALSSASGNVIAPSEYL